MSVLWLLGDTAPPLFGYSLELLPSETGRKSVGSVTVDVVQTSFFPTRNLILAGGADLDPFFSVIQASGEGGVFVSANTADGSSVLPVDGVNDVLAEVVFTAAAGTLGDFVFELGPGTALSDGNGFPVPFEGRAVTVRVVPGVGSAAPLFALVVMPRRRRSC